MTVEIVDENQINMIEIEIFIEEIHIKTIEEDINDLLLIFNLNTSYTVPDTNLTNTASQFQR